MGAHNNRIVTVVTLKPNHGVDTKVFDEPESALKYWEELCVQLDPSHLIQVWDTGYKIEEGHGRARDRSGAEAVHQDDVRAGSGRAPR